MEAITIDDMFDPAALSLAENDFIIQHGGKPPAVVAKVAPPIGVNIKAVMPVIEKLYALDEVQKHDKEPWVGVSAIKARCQLYLDQSAEWHKLKAARGRTFPTYPTMAGWDSRGRPAMGATGADCGHVRTYFDERTIAPWRGEGLLYPNPRRVRAIDSAGREYPPIARGLSGTLLTTPLRPGESYTTTLAFDLPNDVVAPRLELTESDAVTRLLLGHENSPLHGKTLLALGRGFASH